MDQSELKYAIRVDEKAFFIRFYCWLYQADKTKINFCKLFWAYVFVAPALFLRGIVGTVGLIGKGLPPLGRAIAKGRYLFYPVGWGWNRLRASMYHGKAQRRELQRRELYFKGESERQRAEILAAREPKRDREVMQSALGFVEHSGTKAVMKIKTAAASEPVKVAKAQIARQTSRAVTRVGEITTTPIVGRALLVTSAILSMSLLGLGLFYSAPVISSVASGVAYSVSEAAIATGHGASEATQAVVHSEVSLWALMGIFAIVILVTTIMAAIAIGLPYMVVKYLISPAGNAVSKVVDPTGRVIEGGLRGFGQVMYLGYYAVKTSTCPRIEIEPRPNRSAIRTLERETDLA